MTLVREEVKAILLECSYLCLTDQDSKGVVLYLLYIIIDCVVIVSLDFEFYSSCQSLIWSIVIGGDAISTKHVDSWVLRTYSLCIDWDNYVKDSATSPYSGSGPLGVVDS